MLYNINKKEIKTVITCLDCPYWDSQKKVCSGVGITCFEVDPTTKTLIEPASGLPLKLKENENGNT